MSVWCYLSKSHVVHIYEVLHEKVTKILEENFFLFSFPVPKNHFHFIFICNT